VGLEFFLTAYSNYKRQNSRNILRE